MEKIRKCFLMVTGTLAAISGIAMLICIFITVINAICRKFFGFAFTWCDEIVQYVAVEACFVGTAYLLMKNQELSVGVLASVIRSKLVLKIIRLVFVALELAVFYLLSRYCLTAAASLKMTGMMLNTVNIPKYYLYYILEATFILDFIALLSAPILNKGGFYRE